MSDEELKVQDAIVNSLIEHYKAVINQYKTEIEQLKNMSSVKPQPCDDAVSREDTKKFLYERIERLNDDELYDIFSRIIDDMYNELPPVNPQPKTGHWIDNNNGTITCSYCHTWFNKDDRYSYMNYCPNCNAKMVEPQEEKER